MNQNGREVSRGVGNDFVPVGSADHSLCVCVCVRTGLLHPVTDQRGKDEREQAVPQYVPARWRQSCAADAFAEPMALSIRILNKNGALRSCQKVILFDKGTAVCCAHNLSAGGAQIPHLQPERYFLRRTCRRRK